MGNSEELRKQADDLETITQASVEAYKQVATISEEEIKNLMDHETWILPEDAKAYGFCTDIDNEDDEGNEPKQSAFSLIMQKLTTPTAVIQLANPDPDVIADAVANKVLAALQPKEEPKTEEPANSWDNFFRR